MKRALESQSLPVAKYMRGISETQFNEAFVVHSAMDQLINIENCFQCLHGGATEEATATTDASLLVSRFSQKR